MHFFFITLDLVDSKRIPAVARSIFYSAALVSLAGVLQYLFRFHLLELWVKENPNIIRINSTFSDPNSLGTYLVTIGCFGIFAYLSKLSTARKLDIVLVAVIFAALVFTASRAAWGAAFLTLFIFPAALRKSSLNPSSHFRGPLLWIAKYGLYVAAIILVIVFVAAVIGNYADKRPGSLAKVALTTLNPRLPLDQILKGRVELWWIAIDVFKHYPVFGYGLGSVPKRSLSVPYLIAYPENTHNYFLQILAETGILGFLLFCAVIFVVFRIATRRIQFAKTDEFVITYGLLFGLLAFLLTSQTGHPLLLLKLQLIFWGFIGILFVESNSDNNLTVRFPRIPFILLLVILPLLGISQIRSILDSRHIPSYEYGYYAWETDIGRKTYRWTGKEAISIMEAHGNVLSFYLRNFNPDVKKRPMLTSIYLNDELLETVTFSDTDWKQVKYLLPGLKTTGTYDFYELNRRAPSSHGIRTIKGSLELP